VAAHGFSHSLPMAQVCEQLGHPRWHHEALATNRL
jgi:hypothetical protein